MEGHQGLVHEVMIAAPEKSACSFKPIVTVIMNLTHATSVFDLNRTASTLNANMNQIGNMLATFLKHLHTPVQLPSPEDGPIQQAEIILEEAEAHINSIPLPIHYAKPESQSCFDQNAQVLDISK